ncbi:MAG: lytic transglycosylase domain-containing protein [Spirochaetes bacterium]|nr:lytic transglycosylase domain-containing protein [Spirochaetota bacterium]
MKVRLDHLIIALTAILLSYPAPGDAKIHRRVHADGTVEYYNRPAPPPRLPSPARRVLSSRFDGLIEGIAAKQGVDPHLVKCVVRVESDFNPDAVSSAGAMGLMQIMQETADHYSLEDPFDPEKNLDTGIRHLKYLLNYFKNDVPLALAAYHAGIGRVKKNMSLPPIRATIDYVNAVMFLYTGKKDSYSARAVKRLYQRIEKDGTILIYSR